MEDLSNIQAYLMGLRVSSTASSRQAAAQIQAIFNALDTAVSEINSVSVTVDSCKYPVVVRSAVQTRAAVRFSSCLLRGECC